MADRRHYQYRHRIFIILMLAAMLPVVILGAYSYHVYVAGQTQRKNMEMQTTANQVKNRVEEVLNNVKQYYSELENREEIKDMIYASDLDYRQYSRLVKAMQILIGPVYLRQYVSGFTFIIKPEDWVISNYGMCRYSEAGNAKEIEELLGEQQDARIQWQCYWLNLMDREPLSTRLRGNNVILSGYMMVLRLPMYASMQDKCVMLINLNETKLKKLILQDLYDMDVTVVNTKGELVCTSNPQIGEYCTKHIRQVETVVDYADITLSDFSRHRISVTNATTNGLIYIVSYNLASTREGARQIVFMSFVLLLVSALVMACAVMGTRIIYMPVSRLMAQFNIVLKDSQPGHDEFTWLEEGFNKVVQNKEALERLVEDQREMLVELFLTRMISGELTQERIDEDVSRFNLQKKAYYVVLCMRIAQQGYRLDNLEQDALTLTVVDHMPAELYEGLFARPLVRSNVIFLILGGGTLGELEKKVEELFGRINSYSTETYGCQMHCGVSRGFSKLKNLRIAYNEGIEALKNSERLIIGGNAEEEIQAEKAISFYSDFGKKDQPDCSYDLPAEQEMRRAVDACEKQAAFDIADQFIDRMTQREVSRQDRYFFLHRFLVAILHVASDAGLSINQIFEKEEANLFVKLDSILNPEGLKQFYKAQIIEPVISNLTQYRRSHSVDIMEQVLTLVKEKNGDITLAECAEQLNYHPSYIWRVLKTEKNMTFTDFVALEKLSKAKEMLTQTSLSVAEIAQRLNYTNTQNFIRFFSKHEGITPGKYRQERKKADTAE